MQPTGAIAIDNAADKLLKNIPLMFVMLFKTPTPIASPVAEDDEAREEPTTPAIASSCWGQDPKYGVVFGVGKTQGHVGHDNGNWTVVLQYTTFPA
jgi:hypothetical protein